MLDKLELLVGAGLAPAEALTAATSAPAEVFGLSGRGVLEAGSRADVVLLDEDPTTDSRGRGACAGCGPPVSGSAEAVVEVPRAVSRRRGAALERAIHDATLAEVAEVGFEALTIEGIAARAGAGKASIYKRWGSRQAVVLAAITALDDPFDDLRDLATGRVDLDLREALIVVLGRYAAGLGTPTGRALRVLMTQRERHPELYERIHTVAVRPRQVLLGEILQNAARRGYIDPRAVTPWVIAVGPRLIIAQYLERGEVTAADLAAVVDEILLPALNRYSPQDR